MYRFRQVADLALIPVIFWFLMQVLTLVSLTQSATAGIAAAQAANDQTTIQIVICSPTGFKTVTLGPDGEIPEEASEPSDCRWCQAWGNAPDLEAAYGSDLAITLQETGTLTYVENSCLKELDVTANLSIRGPPTL